MMIQSDHFNICWEAGEGGAGDAALRVLLESSDNVGELYFTGPLGQFGRSLHRVHSHARGVVVNVVLLEKGSESLVHG